MSSLSHSVDAPYISIDNSDLVNHISMGRTLPTWRDRIESRDRTLVYFPKGTAS